MGFRTVSTHGMKTTAKVIIFFLRLPVGYYGQLGFLKMFFKVGFVHFFHFLFIYFSYSLLISPHPLPPSREAVQGTFSSDHKDPWHCHWCLIRHSSCSSYYLHPSPDEAAKEKGNSSFVVELLFSRKLDLARGEKTHSWKWWWDSRCSSEDREERQNQHMDFTPLHYTSEIIYHKIV